MDLFHEVEVGSDKVIAHLELFKREQADVDEVNVYLSECDNSCCEVLRLLSECRRSVKPGDGANASSANLKVEALKPPRFDGDIRMYSNFKEDFEHNCCKVW